MSGFKNKFGKDALVAWSMVSFNILWVLVFTVFAIFYCVYLSFNEVDVFADSYTFVGFDNYIESFKDPVFGQSLLNTVVFAVFSILPSVALSILIAVALNQKLAGKTFIRATYFLPSVLPVIAISQVWIWIYEPSYGLLNFFLEKLGLMDPADPIAWLFSPEWAMPSIIIFAIWKTVGYNMVIYLARLQDIPIHLYEAAGIDGAGAVAKFRYITLPELKPATFFVLTTSTINAFQTFGEIYALTKGGPVNSTNMIAYYLYQYAFEFFNIGRGAAVSIILFLILFTVTIVRWKMNERSEAK